MPGFAGRRKTVGQDQYSMRNDPPPVAQSSGSRFGSTTRPREDRRIQPRPESVLSRIEDLTYTVLRRHEGKRPA
jgi:hypothetical protein